MPALTLTSRHNQTLLVLSPESPRSLCVVLLSLFSTWAFSSASFAEVTVTPAADVVHVTIDGQPFTDFVLQGGNAMKPYLYPLRSATGKLVTRKLPGDLAEGEPKDHPHQRGLWFAHSRVNNCDFWNNEADYKSADRGRIVVTKISDAQSGPDVGSFKADLDWVDQNGVKLLTESRKTTLRKTATLRIVDLDLTLTAAGDVTFADAKDGALGMRLAPVLQEPGPTSKGSENQIHGTGAVLNAEGVEGSKAIWGKPSNWVDYSGDVDGEKVGVAVFDHPGNVHRVRWHVRDYALLAGNPFGLKVFTGDKTQDGSVALKPGETLRFRYRVVIHPGDGKSAGLGALWDEYLKDTK